MTMRTFARDITVGKELVSLLVVILLRCLFSQFSLIIQFTEKFCCHLMVRLTGRPTINIKRDTKFLE